MEWTDESMTRLRSLWQEGLSTAEIGRRMQITKNAVVGKAHRLALSARPSPIRKLRSLATTALMVPEMPVAIEPISVDRADEPVLIALKVVVPEAVIEPVPAIIAHPEASTADPAAPNASARDNVRVLRPEIANPDLRRPVPRPRADPVPSSVRIVETPAPRRRGLTCCWPLGEPGTKEFHFCGGEPAPGKPYCAEHAALAYVKLRDRRDSVA